MNKYLPLILIAFVFCCEQKPSYPPFIEETQYLRDSTLAPFYHGVASGDPMAEQVIIWTRVTPKDSLPSIEVAWEVAVDEGFTEIIRSGVKRTDPGFDYTVKVDVDGLAQGSRYFYRFKALGVTSLIGKTKTISSNAEEVRFGVVSCSNYEWGYFNAYGAIAKEELDAVIHLGDYIYEYGPGGYGDTTLGRVAVPDREILSLQDYRSRYAQYRLDPDLRAAHANHPFINIWDDHEITNDSYKDGAENHQEDEGSYEARKNIARQVYYEWLPIREGEKHYRAFNFGALVDLIMLDERLEGRTQQADSLQDPSLTDPDRTMLGTEQLKWFTSGLTDSKAKWKVIGNQVIYSYLNWGHPTFNINLDSWDGYPSEQEKIAQVIKENEITNVVFITGDTHSAWAFEVTNKPFDGYDQKTGDGAFAVEFGTTSINSANSNERFPTEQVIQHEKKIVNTDINPHLKFANMRDHGYLLLSLTEDKVTGQWKFMETVKEPNLSFKEIKTMWVSAGEVKLRE
ncbi:MAG: alkaline phosphatase D family protein [Bacteroidota bacterium]